MRLRGVRRSANIEDRRLSGRRGGVAGGLGIGGVLLVLAIGYFTGIDVTPLLNGSPTQDSAPRQLTSEEERAAVLGGNAAQFYRVKM